MQEPDDDGCKENDCEGTLDKILCLVPEQKCNALEAWQPVIRQFHYKWNRPAAEGRLEHQRGENAEQDAEHIQPDHYKRGILRKERCREKCVDRNFCRATHKGREQDGHGAVALRRERPCRHDCRDRAAETDKHWHDRFAGQADAPQKLVHDERHTRHIAGVFQNRQEEKQCDNDRQEA